MAKELGELPSGFWLLDRYTIIDAIDRGGMAHIYRAHDERLDRVVCAKIMRRSLQVPDGGNRDKILEATYQHFEREALALSRLQHPHTLRIYDYGVVTETSQPVQISEFLEGGNLEQFVKREGAQSWDATFEILEPIFGAVTEAHDHRIVHRDIKPTNILFGLVGTTRIPKLCDFGIAHGDIRHSLAADNDEPSISTVALFSPRWASPEQLCGLPVGPATDVYALALVAIFLLTGEVFFSHKSAQSTFRDRVHGDHLVEQRLAELGLLDYGVFREALRARPAARTACPADFFEALREEAQVFHTEREREQGGVPQRRDPDPTVPSLVAPELAVLAKPLETTDTYTAPPDTLIVVDSPIQRDKKVAFQAGYRVRWLHVKETADMTVSSPNGPVRFRISFLPQSRSLHVKGLSAFVAKRPEGGAMGIASAAITVGDNCTFQLISADRKMLVEIGLQFAQLETSVSDECVFLVDSAKLVVASDAEVAIYLHGLNDILLMSRK